MHNPNENRFEPISPELAAKFAGPVEDLTPAERVKRDWTRLEEGEVVEIKGIRMRVHELGEGRVVLKFLAVMFCFALTLTATAQPPAPPPNPQQIELQKQAELLSAQTQLLYEKLHGLQEFQDYLTDLQKMQQLQQQYQAAATRPTPPAKPEKPAAPASPAPSTPAKK